MALAVTVGELEEWAIGGFGCGEMHSRGGDDCGFVEAIGDVEHG